MKVFQLSCIAFIPVVTVMFPCSLQVTSAFKVKQPDSRMKPWWFQLHCTWMIKIMSLLFQAMKVVSKKKLMKQCGFPRESSFLFPFHEFYWTTFCFLFFFHKQIFEENKTDGRVGLNWDKYEVDTRPLPVFSPFSKHTWFMNGSELSQRKCTW